jgi:acetylornithine deacetylase/succinyl-diaminopimelate desuccinylase-like protein
MGERKDALAAASEMVLALEGIAASVEGAVGTVGEIAVRPGAKNVVPGECVFSIDVRAPEDRVLNAVVHDFEGVVRRVARERRLLASIDVLNRVPVAPLDADLRAVLQHACAAAGTSAHELVSGAGHDAQNAQLAGVPTGMIFIRSTGGSHSPREHADPKDAALAATALAHALAELAS